MAVKYQSYPEYKDSGITWMGNVPKHWGAVRFKHVLSEKKKTSNHDLNAGSISFGKVIYKDAENLSPETKASYQEVLVDEFLINPLNMNYDLLSLRTALSSINVVVSTGYIVLKSNENLIKRYIRWLLQEFDVAHMKTLGSGVRQTINYADISNSYFFEPSKKEQERIAKFLDHETVKIDTLIEKQQQLIKLLQEKRQAVISHAVTKGLNPDATMCESGVEWLGEVPEHWEVLRLFRVGKVGQGCAFSHSIQGQEVGELPWFKVMDMNSFGNDEVMNNASNFVGYDLALNIGAPIFPAEAVIFPRVGAALLTNKRRILSRPSIVDDNIYAFTPSGIHSRFVYMVLQLIDMAMLCSPGLVPTITFSAINNVRIPLPSLFEQEAIVDYLNSQTPRMEALIKKAESAIELMRERRTALISAAVTGKIDVRNWQTPEPSNNNNKEVAA